MTSSPHRELAARVVASAPRVLVIWGPAGYGKCAFLRVYSDWAGALVLCDLSACDGARDLTRPVLEALVRGDHRRAARSAAGRLAQRRDLAAVTARDALRREWLRAEEPELVVLRDVAGALATPAGVDLFGELIATLPASRTLAVSTRGPLPPALDQLVAREPAATIGPDDLALPLDELLALARAAGVPAPTARAVARVARGWPLVSLLLLGIAAREPVDALLREAVQLPPETLLPYAVHHTVTGLDAPLREALVAAAIRPDATAEDLVRVVGDRCDDAVLRRLRALPFVLAGQGRIAVHGDVAALLRARFAALADALYARTLHVLTAAGAHVAASRVALAAGDVAQAAALLDAAPPYTAARTPLAEYERILDRLDRDLITRFPNVWIATIPYRRFAVERAAFVAEAETVYYCLPRSASAEQRAAALMHLASAYANVGRIAESDALLDEALAGFAAPAVAARASLLNFSASLRGGEGRFALARALAEEAAAISRDDFGENLTLHHIEANEAVMRGKYARAVVIIDELVRRSRRDELPLYLAYAATNGALFAWTNGDDDAFARYLATLEDALTPGLERGFAPMIDAAHGRPVALDDAYAWPVLAAIAQLYRMGEAASAADALDAARAAALAADERRDPLLQLLAHAAVYVLDPPGRHAERATLTAVVATVESPELRDAVAGIVAGSGAGVLEPFVRRRVLREREHAAPTFVVELLAGRVTRDGAPVRLSDKELELMVLLASTHGSLSRDRIGAALWDHLDPAEWPNNLKVTLSRLRAKLGVRDAVLVGEGSYRLSPAIDVDVRRFEALVRESGAAPLADRTRAALIALTDAYRSGAPTRYDRFAWMQPSLARIHDLLCTGGNALADDALRRNDPAAALAHAAAVVEIDPFNEGACEATIRAHLARGEVGAARREFRRYAAALASELGAEPAERLATLVRGAV